MTNADGEPAHRDAPEASTDSEALLREAEAVAHVGAWSFDLRSLRQVWSEENFRLLGYTPGEIEPSFDAFVERVHPDDRADVERTLEESLGRDSIEAGYRVVMPDGAVRHMNTIVQIDHDADGAAVRMQGVTHDVTAVEHALTAARDTEELLVEAQHLARVGHWARNPTTKQLTWSAELRRIFELPPDETPAFEKTRRLVHPSDRPRVERLLDDLLRAARDGDRPPPPVLDVHRLLLPGGRVKWIELRAQVDPVGEGTGPTVRGTVQDVTERETAIASLRASEELLAKSQRLARLGTWTLDLQTDELTWSDEVFRIFEIDRKRFGASYEAFLGAIHPDDRAAVDTAYSGSLERRQPYLITHRLLMPDGRIKWVEERAETEFSDTGTPLLSRGTVQDVTEQVQLRAEADRVSGELSQIVGAAPLPIILVDEHGIITAANPATERTFQYAIASLVGKNVATLTADLSADQHGQYVRHYVDTGTASTPEGLVVGRTREVRGRRADGTEFPAELTVAEIPAFAAGRRFAGIITDRTEARRQEEQILRMHRLEVIGTLIAGVAHDFNNLLTGIIGGLELAERQPGEPRWIELASQSAERAAEVVRRLLRFSRDEPPVRDAVTPREIVDAVLGIARETIDRRITLSGEIDDDLPTVFADAAQIEQVLLNLVVNARDATLERAEASPEPYEPTIRISAAPTNHEGRRGVVFAVHDNGAGMPESVRRRAFDPFFTTKPAEHGTGLGLPIAAGIVGAHDGVMEVTSTEGAGTTVTVWLPLAGPEGELPEPRGTSADPDVEALRPARRVLVVDDEAAIGDVAAGFLESAGFEVTFVLTGDAAIAAAVPGRFDVAVVDINMPQPDGWAVLAALRERCPGLPAIVASGFADAARVREEGGAALIQKPYAMRELIAAVERAIAAGRP